jgi:4-methyl-5(b-hydroxyethyl)-thiazole monophosphate biosynthesis
MKVMVPFANGFEEIEALTAVDLLRWAGIEVDMVGVVGSVITGVHGIKVMMDKKMNEARIDSYDGIVLPGGSPGYENLGKSKTIVDAIISFNEGGKLVAAICYSPILLANIGVLDNRKATVYPGMESKIPYPREDKIVVDGNIITSQGPGTAIAFSLAIIEYFMGPEKASKMKKIIVA